MRRILSQFGVMFAVAILISGAGTTSLMYSSSDAEARGFSRSSSSRSFSRPSRSSSPSKSYSKPAKSKPSKSFFSSYKKPAKTRTASVTKKKPTKFTSNKGGGTSKVSMTKRSTGMASVGNTRQRQKSKAALTTQRNKFKKPTYTGTTGSSKTRTASVTRSSYNTKYNSNPVYSRSRSYDRGTYYTRRDSYYGGWDTPSYVYGGSPSYGMLDTLFMYSMLNNMNNNHASSFAHNNQNNADYKAWRLEADKQAQTNAELRAKLAQLDAGQKSMTGQPIDPSYVPPGVDADLMLAQEAREAQKPIFRNCVGGQSGAYFLVTANVLIPNLDDVAVVPVITSGTHEILAKLEDGSCDGGFVQSDGYWNYIEEKQVGVLPFERVFSPFREAVHLACNVKGPTEVSDLGSNHKVWFPENSGAMETWINFTGEDDDYLDVKTVLNTPSMTVASNEEAFLKITTDKNSCALFVGAPGATAFMRNVEAGAKGSKIVLIQVNDSDFNDTEDPAGDDVYTFQNIPQKTYPKLLRNAGSIYGGGSAKTLYLNADFVVSNKWKKANAKLYPIFANKLIGLQPEIELAVKQ